MAETLGPPSRVVIRASGETIALCASACAMTFALAYVVHSKPAPSSAPAAATEEWTGHLSGPASGDAEAAKPAEKVTSASLVVAKEQLSLPKLDATPLAKLRFCDTISCSTKASTISPPAPARSDLASRRVVKVATRDENEERPSLLSRLNPLNQVPAVIRKPFAYAGDTVSGWIKRF